MAPPLGSPNTLAPSLLFARDAASSFADARTTLSSWDNCMSKAYCKWPVIIVIILGALIVLSLLFCCFRCLCCGLECCCGCFSCCNACCPKPRGSRKNKHYQPAPQQPYNYPGNTAGPQPWHPSYYQPQPQPQDTMMYGAVNGASGQKRLPSNNVPRHARFSSLMSSKNKIGEKTGDALPAMPSWHAAQERQVEDTSYHAAGTNGAHGEEGIPLQDRKTPNVSSAPQASTFGTPEYEQGYKSLPSPPLPSPPTDEYSTGQHQGGAVHGFSAAPVRHQPQGQNRQPYRGQHDAYSPSPVQNQYGHQEQPPQPYNNNTDYPSQQNQYPIRTVSPISPISSPPISSAATSAPYSASTSHAPPLPLITNLSPTANPPHAYNYSSPPSAAPQCRPHQQSPTSPTASSIYSARPPPSYHTNANSAYPPSRGSSNSSRYPPQNRNRDFQAPPMPPIPQAREPVGRQDAHEYGSNSMYAAASSAQTQTQAQQQRHYRAYKPPGGMQQGEREPGPTEMDGGNAWR